MLLHMRVFSIIGLLLLWGPMAIGTYVVIPSEKLAHVSVNDNTDFIIGFVVIVGILIVSVKNVLKRF